MPAVAIKKNHTATCTAANHTQSDRFSLHNNNNKNTSPTSKEEKTISFFLFFYYDSGYYFPQKNVSLKCHPFLLFSLQLFNLLPIWLRRSISKTSFFLLSSHLCYFSQIEQQFFTINQLSREPKNDKTTSN